MKKVLDYKRMNDKAWIGFGLFIALFLSMSFTLVKAQGSAAEGERSSMHNVQPATSWTRI